MTSPETASPVVVGIDGSSASRSALAWAARWAGHFGHPVRLLTAEQMRTTSPLVRDQVQQDIKAKLRAEAAAIGDENARLVISADVAWVGPAEALIEASRTATLVVVGNRGIGGWYGLTLGSVSDAVSSHAHCPVVVVPDGMQPDRLHGEVVLGIDGSPESIDAAEFAFAQAARLSTRLRAVHVRTAPNVFGASITALSDRGPLPSEEEAERMRWMLNPLRAEWPDVIVEERYLAGDPARSLADEGRDAAIVVVGSRGSGGFPGLLLGSTSRDLLQIMPCAVAVVRGVTR